MMPPLPPRLHLSSQVAAVQCHFKECHSASVALLQLPNVCEIQYKMFTTAQTHCQHCLCECINKCTGIDCHVKADMLYDSQAVKNEYIPSLQTLWYCFLAGSIFFKGDSRDYESF